MTDSLVARQHGVAASQLFPSGGQYRKILLSPPENRLFLPLNFAAAMKQIKELQRLLGKKTMENELLKEAVEYGRAKVDSARALIARDGISSQPLSPGVACAVARHSQTTDDWMDGRRSRHTDDTDVLLRIHHVIG